jgi:NAD(P)-binding Rossmann-like domain
MNFKRSQIEELAMNAPEYRPPLHGVIAYQSTESSSGIYDAIIVGAGHHGLTCAAFLAKAGKRVLVLDARDVVGGMCWTREMDNAPGYQVSPCALELLLMGASPSIVDLSFPRNFVCQEAGYNPA